MITVENLSKDIQARRLITDISFSVPEGSALAIVGPNGAGKSVALRATGLVDPPTTGTVRIGGTTYVFPGGRTVTPPPWPSLTVVFQQLFLWPHLTLRQNALLQLRTNRDEICSKRLHQFVDLFQLGGAIDRYPNEVSLGQRQLGAIIRALVIHPRPKCLLLDECTSALDVEQTSRVLELLMQLKKHDKLTIVFVSHLLGFAAALADQVLFIENGMAGERGGPEILARPRTDRMRRFVSLVESLSDNERDSDKDRQSLVTHP